MKDEMSTDQTPDFLASSTTRRQLLALAAVGGAGVAAVAAAARRPRDRAPGPGTNGEVVRLTVLGTTDLHGNVFNWDYFKNAEYDDGAHNDIGVAKVATLIKAIARRARAPSAPSRSTPATPSRARRWPTTTPRSTRSPAARCTRWPRR